MKLIKQIPNFFTSLNLIFGLLAIVSISNQTNSFEPIILILFAALSDFLDGYLAKRLKAISEFGKQLDSMADLVSFGIAPGFLVYSILSNNKLFSENDWFSIFAYVSLLIPLFSAYRLAIFNISTYKKHFQGLPTPANALLYVSLYGYIKLEGIDLIIFLHESYYYIVLLIILSSILMVSKIRFISLKISSTSIKSNIDRVVLIIALLILYLVLGNNSLLFLIPVYILISLIFHFLKIKQPD